MIRRNIVIRIKRCKVCLGDMSLCQYRIMLIEVIRNEIMTKKIKRTIADPTAKSTILCQEISAYIMVYVYLLKMVCLSKFMSLTITKVYCHSIILFISISIIYQLKKASFVVLGFNLKDIKFLTQPLFE